MCAPLADRRPLPHADTRSLSAPLAAFLLSSNVALAAPTGSAQPDVEASIKFPDSNPFGRVENGNSNNLLHVRVQNHADHPITVLRVRGQYREATGKERPLREVSLRCEEEPG